MSDKEIIIDSTSYVAYDNDEPKTKSRLEIKRENKDVFKRDPKTGRFLKGTGTTSKTVWKKGQSGNPGGRPKLNTHLKLLKDLFGEDGLGLVVILIAQMYNKDFNGVFDTSAIEDAIIKKADSKKWDYRTRVKYDKQIEDIIKKLAPHDKRLACDNAKYLLDRMFGRAKEYVETDNVNHNKNETKITFVEPRKIDDIEEEIERRELLEELERKTEE